MKKTLHPEKPKTQPRANARKSKLKSLTLIQTQALLRWLAEENLTYALARERMLKQFEISLSMAQMSEFWHCHVKPKPSVSTGAEVLIELVIHSCQPVRLIVKKNSGGIGIGELPIGEPISRPIVGINFQT